MADSRVRRISFTGSTALARRWRGKVQRIRGERLPQPDPASTLADRDLEWVHGFVLFATMSSIASQAKVIAEA